MSLPPGYEYILALDIPIISVCCKDSSHPPAHAAFFGFYEDKVPQPGSPRGGRWEIMPPRRITKTDLFTDDLISNIDPTTNAPTGDPRPMLKRYNIKCPWCPNPTTVPVRKKMDRLSDVLDTVVAYRRQLGDDAGDSHPELFVDGVLTIPLPSLAARL